MFAPNSCPFKRAVCVPYTCRNHTPKHFSVRESRGVSPRSELEVREVCAHMEEGSSRLGSIAKGCTVATCYRVTSIHKSHSVLRTDKHFCIR